MERELTDADLDLVIDPGQEWQCRWWSYDFGVTPEEVRAAALAVGGSANAIRAHLAASKAQP